jgi:hypothetical protein
MLPDMDDPTVSRMLSWGRYLYWSELMRHRWDEYMTQHGDKAPIPGFLAASGFWGGSLYVVIEGWDQMKLTDQVIDALLRQRTNKEGLKKLRKAMFDFHPSFFSQDLMNFTRTDDMTLWQITLHEEFCRFFREWVDSLPGTLAEQNKSRDGVMELVGWIPPKPAEDHIKSLEKQIAEVERRFTDTEDSATRAEMRDMIDTARTTIANSLETARFQRLERLSKLGIQITEDDLPTRIQ